MVPASPHGLAVKAHADALVRGIRGISERTTPRETTVLHHRPLAEILPISEAVPALAYPPSTRRIDEGGRIAVRLDGRGIAEILGFEPGPLELSIEGLWVILRPLAASTSSKRHDGRCTLSADDRVRLSSAALRHLALTTGQEVAVLAVPEHRALALCHPSRLLTGAPLSLLTQSTDCQCGAKGHHS